MHAHKNMAARTFTPVRFGSGITKRRRRTRRRRTRRRGVQKGGGFGKDLFTNAKKLAKAAGSALFEHKGALLKSTIANYQKK